MPLPHKGLDDAHAGQVLLCDGVHLVDGVLHGGKERVRAAVDQHQRDHHKGRQHHQDQRELWTGEHHHHQRADHEQGRAHEHAQHHHQDLLHLSDVVGEPRDELAGAQLIQVGKGKGLDLAIERLTQVIAIALAHEHGEHAVAGAAQHAHGRQAHHGQAGAGDIGHVQVPEPHIDDVLHQAGLEEVHGHLDHHQKGRHDGQGAIGSHIGQQAPEAAPGAGFAVAGDGGHRSASSRACPWW